MLHKPRFLSFFCVLKYPSYVKTWIFQEKKTPLSHQKPNLIFNGVLHPSKAFLRGTQWQLQTEIHAIMKSDPMQFVFVCIFCCRFSYKTIDKCNDLHLLIQQLADFVQKR